MAKPEVTGTGNVKKTRKPRTKADPSTMDPLDRKVFHLKQASKIVKLGRKVDPESRALAIELLQEIDMPTGEGEAAEE